MNSRGRQGLRQRGEGKGAIIFWLLIFVVAGVVAKEWIPAKIKDMQLRDYMIELAELKPRGGEREFRDAIRARAKQLNIVLKPEDVHVEKTARRVHMIVEYTTTMDFIVTTHDWTFRHDIERDIFII